MCIPSYKQNLLLLLVNLMLCSTCYATNNTSNQSEKLDDTLLRLEIVNVKIDEGETFDKSLLASLRGVNESRVLNVLKAQYISTYYTESQLEEFHKKRKKLTKKALELIQQMPLEALNSKKTFFPLCSPKYCDAPVPNLLIQNYLARAIHIESKVSMGYEITKALIRKRVDVNTKDIMENTELIILANAFVPSVLTSKQPEAAVNYYMDILEQLFKRNVCINMKNEDGQTALDVIKRSLSSLGSKNMNHAVEKVLYAFKEYAFGTTEKQEQHTINTIENAELVKTTHMPKSLILLISSFLTFLPHVCQYCPAGK